MVIKKNSKIKKDTKVTKKVKNNSFFSTDADALFERFIAEKNKGLKNLDSIRNSIVKTLDVKIEQLNNKRRFVTEAFINRKELQLKKISVWKQIISNSFFTNLKYLISMPFIYGLILPTMIFHMFLEIYHQVAFRLYNIPLVRPKNYFIFDREHLPYLNWLEKFNCAYCSYFNCLIAYAREIGGRTETYWCPIKHAILRKDAHSHYKHFVDYSNEKVLRKEWENLRKFENDK